MEDIVYAMEDLEEKAEDYKSNILGRSNGDFVIDSVKNLALYEGLKRQIEWIFFKMVVIIC